MTTKDIGVGVIGIGMGATLLLLNQDPASRFEVRALCSPSAEKVRWKAEAAHIAAWTTDYRELIARDDIQVVGVFSPDHLHAEHAAAALRAGKHVVCTKPMVTRVEDAVELVQLVEQTKLKFIVGQTMRFDRQFVAAKRLFDDGDLGEIIFAEAHYVHDARTFFPKSPWRMNSPQDLMYGGASHPIDLLRWFLGDVEEVHAYGRKGNLIPEYPYEDNYLIQLKFRSGAIARVLAAYGVVEPPMPMMGLSLYGSRGSLTADFSDQQTGGLRLSLDKLAGCPPAVMKFDAETTGTLGHGAGVMRYMQQFQHALEQDTTPSPSVHEGAKTIAVCAAAWESIRQGGVVKVRADF